MLAIENLDRGFSINPDSLVLFDHDSGTGRTYREAVDFSHRFANAVRDRGLNSEAKLVVIGANSSVMFEVVLGAVRSDAIYFPINYRSSKEEIDALIDLVGGDFIFYDPEIANLLASRIENPATSGKLIPLRRDEVEAWIGDASDEPFVPDPDAGEVYAIRTTGGTSGLPKAVQLTHQNAEYIVKTFDEVSPFAATEETPRPVFLASAPVTHAAGEGMQLTLHLGGTGIMLRGAKPAELIRLIEQYKVTHLFLPPTVIYGMLEQPDVRDFDYSTLQYLYYGAAPMSPEKLAMAIDIFGPCLAQIYGQTETGVPNVFMAPRDHFVDNDFDKGLISQKLLSSAGKPTHPGEFAIFDEDGNVVGPNVRGEIGINGIAVTPGYYRDEEQTRLTKRDGYHMTGDIAYQDEEGYVFIVDRLRDMIITGGFNVYSAEVERVVLSFPFVQECSVFGIPDEKWGEAVTVAIEIAPGKNVDEGELRAFCREQLGPVKTPKHFYFYDELPRTPTGKVLKRELRAEFWAGQERLVS